MKVSDLFITKKVDIASIPIFIALHENRPLSIEIRFVRLGGNNIKNIPFLTYKLTNAMVTSVSRLDETAEKGMPREAFTLAYSRLEQGYTEIGTDGRPSGGAIQHAYDVRAGQA